MALSAVVPARDEAGRVARTVRALRSVEGLREVIVVDDGSRDETSREAHEAGARVVRHSRPKGKADAVGLGAALASEELIVLCDADLAESARCLAAVALPVSYGRAEMAIAVLPPSGCRAGIGATIGLARWGVRRLAGLALSAPLSGQRVLWRRLMRSLGPTRGFGLEVALSIDTVRAGFRVIEVPTLITHRSTGRDLRGWLHRGGQLVDVAYTLAARWRG